MPSGIKIDKGGWQNEMKLKKTITCILSLTMAIASVMGMAGCEYPDENLIESGDFAYWVSVDGSDFYLENLSEQGKQKETIVIPYQIDGYDVWCYTYEWWLSIRGNFESEVLKQLYVLPNVSICTMKLWLMPNLEKMVFIGTNMEAIRRDCIGSGKDGPGEANLYVSSIDNLDEQADERGYITSGYFGWRNLHLRLTNCNFMYNFEGAGNDGYYWADYFEYGEKIGYIPENPVREGYIFGGWYKDAEGVNVWNFETDTLPEAQYNEEGQELHQETRLYAKWYQN